MFGQNDNQQPTQDNTMQPAATSGSLSNDGQSNESPAPDNNQPFSSPTGAPSMSEPITTAPSVMPSTTMSADNTTADPSNDDLMSLKQQALQHLSPLVSHLDQTPEEKFRTTMMMIQASDDQSLIKTAFESAQKITDDKARAQALLDIINEINYFTQHQPTTNQDSDSAL